MKELTTAAAALALLAAAAGAQVSLWDAGPGGRSENASILRPVKARDFQVHDIVHIIVVVAAESTTEEETGLERSSDTNRFSLDRYIKLHNSGGLVPYLKGRQGEDLDFEASGEKEFEGEGTAEREDTLRTRLAAEIVEIKPNGNLAVEARSRVAKTREKTVITLSGVVRPQDVAPDNTVYSYNISDLDINYESSGPVSGANERGWFLKFLDKIWPF